MNNSPPQNVAVPPASFAAAAASLNNFQNEAILNHIFLNKSNIPANNKNSKNMNNNGHHNFNNSVNSSEFN